MKNWKENVEINKEKNLVSSVLMVCFLIFALSFWGAFSFHDSHIDDTGRDPQILALSK